MTQPTKPSAGALGAALQIYEATQPVVSGKVKIGPTCALLAHIIDRETGVVELLEAANELRIAVKMYVQGGGAWELHCVNAKSYRVEQAIAKCEGK